MGAVKTLGGEVKLNPKVDQGLLSPPSTPYYASTDSTSENEIRYQSLSSTLSGANSKGITEANIKTPHTVTPLLISIPFGRLSSHIVQRIIAKQGIPNSPLSSYEAEPSSLKTKILPIRPPVSCIFCDIALPIGTDQDTCLQHFEVCPVKANFECDELQPAIQVKRVKLNPFTNSLSLKGVKFSCAEPGCREEYSNKNRLADHQRRAHGAKKLKCKDLNCSASFFATPTFRKHMGRRSSNVKKLTVLPRFSIVVLFVSTCG